MRSDFFHLSSLKLVLKWSSIIKVLLIFTFNVFLVRAATHSLQYFDTAVTPGINFPEFTIVGLVDGEQFEYYDSNIKKAAPKTQWIKKIDGDDADYWNTQTQHARGLQETQTLNLDTLMKRFNQTKGVHTRQCMFGCELDDDGTKKIYVQYGYDGQDFLNLDLNTLTWTAANPKAEITKHKWEDPRRGGYAARWKNYLENRCIEYLQKYVAYGRDTLERKVRPEVSMFQKDSSVVCHATGFFPKQVMIFWKKDGKDLIEDVELRETLVNHDGNYQKRSILKVSPEDLKKHEYTCVIQHVSLDEDMVQKFESGGLPLGIIIGVVVALLLVIVIGCGVFIWKKKSGKTGFSPAPSEDSGSNHSSELKTIKT